jgi:hypothetical protein
VLPEKYPIDPFSDRDDDFDSEQRHQYRPFFIVGTVGHIRTEESFFVETGKVTSQPDTLQGSKWSCQVSSSTSSPNCRKSNIVGTQIDFVLESAGS